MSVIHILKNGETVKDITGHVVRLEDVSPLYQLIHSINRKTTKSKNSRNYKMR
jgi:hypothetical protein